MSQVKASPTVAQAQFALQQQQLDQEQFSSTTSGPVHRIMTRRASRSAQSHSTIPIIVETPAEPENHSNHANDNDDTTNNNNKDDDNNNSIKEDDNDDDISMDPTTPIPTDNINSRMTTRSRSIDLNQSNNNNNITYGASSAEESSNTSSTSQITKKRRTKTIKGKTKTKSRKRGIKTSSLSPPITTPTTTTKRRNEESLRGSRRRNAKDNNNNNNNNGAETTQLDAVKLKKLAELDELEKTILDGTHEEYRERMAHAETKRLNEMKNAKLRRDLEEDDIRFTFEAFRKAAYDQFYQCKAELRKRMINQIQAQIKRSEEEWHTLSHENTGCSDDDQELYDWLPHRHTSIYFEPLGLKQEEILDDITAARSKIYITENK